MFCKTIGIIYNGIKFDVTVPCVPETPITELKERAFRTVIDLFR